MRLVSSQTVAVNSCMSPIFNFRFFSQSLESMSFCLGCTVLHTFIFLVSYVIKKCGQEKELSIETLCPVLSTM